MVRILQSLVMKLKLVSLFMIRTTVTEVHRY